MRILVLSDIHANLNALEAVLADAGAVEETWCLGDIVGYGPEPETCIERLRELKDLRCVLGNHDAAVLGRIDIYTFNHEARQSLLWQKDHLSWRSLKFLEELADSIILENLTLVHGSPRNPVWEYIMDYRAARQNFGQFNTQGCLVGHTHVQAVFSQGIGKEVRLDFHPLNEAVVIKDRFILNPGSVGQPRDRDPRAAYAIYDTDDQSWEFRRVNYDIEAVQKAILQAGLPRMHAYRLKQGT